MKTLVFFSLSIASLLVLSHRVWTTILWVFISKKRLCFPRKGWNFQDFAGFFLASVFLFLATRGKVSLFVLTVNAFALLSALFWGTVLLEAYLYFRAASRARAEFFFIYNKYQAGIISAEEMVEAHKERGGAWSQWVEDKFFFFPKIFSIERTPIFKESEKIRKRMLEKEGIIDIIRKIEKEQ